MTRKTTIDYDETIARIKAARAEAIEHTRLARQFAAKRKELMLSLIDAGYTQADIARELDVSRQAIQKMLTLV
jgi:DNA-binding XRE family transcriptional regulator